MMFDGREATLVEVADTGSEIRNVQFNVDNLRWDLEHEADLK
jgi:hypothetical protein